MFSVEDANGRVRTETTTAPWLLRHKPREVILEHAEVDRLNGRTRPTEASYTVNGWTIDPANDRVLAERLAKVRAAVEEIMPAERLVLPVGVAARRAKLEDITRLQEKVINRVFADNFVEHPGNNPRANETQRAG